MRLEGYLKISQIFSRDPLIPPRQVLNRHSLLLSAFKLLRNVPTNFEKVSSDKNPPLFKNQLPQPLKCGKIRRLERSPL